MTTSRQKILTHLKKTRAATAREIARALKLSPPNVRHHLSVLGSDGRVEVTGLRESERRGRPEKLYSLAQSALGDNLSVLVEALLADKVNARRVGARMAQSQGLTDLSTVDPVAKRLTLLVEKLNEMHFQARWEAGAEGPRVLFGRCPYAKVIAAHPEICQMDAAMLEAALSRPIQPLQRGELMPGLCPFLFRVG